MIIFSCVFLIIANCTNLRTVQYYDNACQDLYGSYALGYDNGCYPGVPGTFVSSGQMSCVVGDAVIDTQSTIMRLVCLVDLLCVLNVLQMCFVWCYYCVVVVFIKIVF